MDHLELNIRQLTLSDLAESIGEVKGEGADADDVVSAIDLITSRVETRQLSKASDEQDNLPDGYSLNGDSHENGEAVAEERVFMSNSRVQCNIGFAELAINMPHSHVKDTVPVLVDILRDVPYIDFDRCLSWDEWAMPDQLVSTTVTALLKIASAHPEYRQVTFDAITNLVKEIVPRFQTEDSFDVLSQYAPAFHGLYRAVISIPFDWSPEEWRSLAEPLNQLFLPDTIERLNKLPIEALSGSGEDVEKITYVQTLVSRYISCGRPLTGYFIVCCVIEAKWTILAQAMSRTYSTKDIDVAPAPQEAAAANIAWQKLLKYHEPGNGFTEESQRVLLRTTMRNVLHIFATLLVLIQEMDSDPADDSYAWETMSESLKLAAVCCAALDELDSGLYERLKTLLSSESPIVDSMVQEAALKSTSILVRCFPDIAAPMANHLRRFVTSPLSIFEFEFASTARTPSSLLAAARCLSLCIDLAPGDDLIMSYMYSLLNYIAATSKDIFETSSIIMNLADVPDLSTLHSVETGLRGLSEDEKRTVGISTISVASRLALENKNEEVTRLTISMLLQRMRAAEPTVEAAIAYNLVDLALIAPQSAFVDIIRAFSSINRSANLDDTRFSNNMVLAAQTRLAKELRGRPELYQLYLTELLTLFADKGVAIQNAAISNHHAKLEEMSEQLASLLLPIDALLSHEDFEIGPDASYNVVTLFRNMWFLCALFGFTAPATRTPTAMEWRQPALARIATRTPPIVLEEAHDTIVSDLEYNTVIRQEYVETVIAKPRALLTKHIPLRASEVRYLLPGQVLFLLAMHDVESMRAAAGCPSSLVTYFVNKGINKNTGLLQCMEAVAEKVIRGAISDLNGQAAKQALPSGLSMELRALLVASTHRILKAREIAARYLNRLITSFPSLMCDPPLVFAILEVLTLLRRATENEFLDEDNPTYTYYSDRADFTLQLTDNYEARNQMLSQLQREASTWFELALSRAPIELHSTLQKYLATVPNSSLMESCELGASIALNWAKAIGPIERKLASLSSMSIFKPDRAKTLANQLASKGYYTGEAAGFKFGRASGLDGLDDPLSFVPKREITLLKKRIADAITSIRDKTNTLTVADLKRLLFRAASTLIFLEEWDHDLAHYLVALPFEAFTQASISAGIECWSWVIAEKPTFEVTLMSEIAAAWDASIKHGKGMFSKSQNYVDPFLQEVQYSPTDKATIDRLTRTAARLITPHGLILQLLFSRLQAARYRRPGLMLLFQRLALSSARAHETMSTHPLAREARFSFLLFGFEVLKSSFLDVFCEHQLRTSLYNAAYSWFAVRPQWSHGSNRVQVDADIKLLSEFLSYLQADSIRGYAPISSLAPTHAPTQAPYYIAALKNLGLPLRLLVENEVFRLTVWGNPVNDTKRGQDHICLVEKTMLDNAWTAAIRRTWNIDPAIAVYMAERFSQPAVQTAVSSLVRSNTRDVLDVPEGLHFLVTESLGASVQRDLRYLLLWAPVPPVLAITFFERRYNNHPQLLQYAHRVLEQHPVDLTFFFVPQVVQALRYDDLGYVARFIFETAKISQLFCHQIIWNMKANCYRDDAGEQEDPMKPTLDRMTDMVVDSLSGEARAFYDREFGFFNEVTSISGKLKPFIKRTKPEKKAKIDEEMAKIVVQVGVYLPSNPDGKVIDIDKKSGRPLQSHAKAPFMATFKVRKERLVVKGSSDNILDADTQGQEETEEYDIWQQAIFKVGDDCRQDVLALQVIAMFKNIFTSVGLTLYVYPYRVTATAPGCGVIDVVPNATSRDEMGRAKVNDLLDFFVAKYGGEDTVEFQKARLNFIQSMAAYSVVCYILQVKDRHNGNIMIDGEGHIVHIDFGFLFDIDESWHIWLASLLILLIAIDHATQGVKFEPNSFKLTHEMVVLMGGRTSQGYQLFQQLTVKAFLAIRPHADQLVSTVQLMLDTCLPSFKGEPTIRRLKERFALHLNERQAAEYMMSIVRNAYENVRSTVYDEFQRLQNGIPYK